MAGEGKAVFVNEDRKTKGDWEVSYGKDGAMVTGSAAKYPAYAAVTEGGDQFIWEGSSGKDTALFQVDGEERIAACHYGDQVVFDLALKDGTHRVALYCIDWNTTERKQKIEVLDGASGTVLDTREISAFADGRYLVWDLAGHVKIRLTKIAGRNAVMSGIFFGAAARSGPRLPKPPPPPPTTAGHHKQRFEAHVGNETIKVPYLLYLPVDYFNNKERYPLLLFLHGVGEIGTDLEAVYGNGPDGVIRNDPNFKKDYKFIGLGPQCIPGRRWDTPGSSTAILQVLDYVTKTYRVDADRVYVTGLSMGGKGTWLVAEEGADRFAAVAPISAVEVDSEKAAKVFQKTSLWIICGGDDGDFMHGSHKMYDTLKKANVDAYLTEVPHEGHCVWFRYYQDRSFYDWLLKHKRGANQPVPLPPCGVFNK